MPQKQKRKCNTDDDKQNENQQKIIGRRFRLFRESMNMTQHEMTSHLSINDSAISNIETGKYSLRFELLLILHAKFKLNSNWLLTGEGGMTTTPLEIPENCRELVHFMNVPEVEQRIFSDVTDLKQIFKEEIAAWHG